MAGTSGYTKIIRYKVKAHRLQENIEYIQALFSALERDKPDQLRYAAFQLEDGVSFMHIAFVATDADLNPLHQFDEFSAWTKDISSRCEAPPSFALVTTIGEYNYSNNVPPSA